MEQIRRMNKVRGSLFRDDGYGAQVHEHERRPGDGAFPMLDARGQNARVGRDLRGARVVVGSVVLQLNDFGEFTATESDAQDAQKKSRSEFHCIVCEGAHEGQLSLIGSQIEDRLRKYGRRIVRKAPEPQARENLEWTMRESRKGEIPRSGTKSCA